MRNLISFYGALLCIMALAAADVRADLTSRQARRLITRAAGFELPSGAVRVKRISTTGSLAEATAEVETAFRFEKNGRARWTVAEIRSAPDRWEEIEILAQALKAQLPSKDCDDADLPAKGSGAGELSAKRARCLIAILLGVTLPSDAVRIKQVSPLGVPLASKPSALVIALLRVDFHFIKDSKTGWRVSEMRTGNRGWLSADAAVASINEEKRAKARADLETIAKALEAFRSERGFYVASDKQSVLIDHLSPDYLAPVIRVDPWHRSYQYEGQREYFSLRSRGPDGKENTADDIVLASRGR